MYIYLITNRINNRWYIGKRKNGIDTSDFNRYYGSGKLIKQALQKYGKENFIKKVIEECTSYSELCKREIYWINEFIKQYPNKTYNLLTTESLGNYMKGSKQTKEHINKRFKASIKSGAYNWSNERRRKFSEYCTGKSRPTKGKKYKTISDSKKGDKNPNSKKVINLITKEIYCSITEASIKNNIPIGTLWCYLTGSRKNKTNLIYYETLC